jgi:cation diffusion facilitator family transporter
MKAPPVNSSTTHGGTTAHNAANAARTQLTAMKLSLCSNLFLVFIKIAAGLASGAISVLAEGVQSFVDVAASAFILLSIRTAAAPPDRSHPYGHGKFENLASQGQMLLILSTAGYMFWIAWQRWQEPTMPRLDWGAGALSVAIIINFFVSRHLSKLARETHSQALEAEATHLRSDMLACIGVLGGLGAVALTREPRLDPLIAAIMTVVVVVTALRLLHDSVRPLLDERLPPHEEALIRRVLEADTRVLDYHRLRTRRAGSHRLMDVHVLLPDEFTFSQAHATTEEIEDAIRQALPNVDVIVHAEPFEEERRHQREAHVYP